TGHIGLREVNVGQYVNAGVAVVTLQVLDPIYLDFTVPQQAIAQLKLGQTVTAHFDAYPGVALPGNIISIDPRAAPATRNVSMRPQMPNADHRLVPGMYAAADVDVGAPQRYLTLPQTAVTFNPFGSTAWSVDRQTPPKGGAAQLIAHENFIVTGSTRGDQV